MFTPNVGNIDRILRIAVGAILIVLASTSQIGPWGWIGIVPLLTGVIRWCPTYLPFGLSTCKRP
jgi:hypothetical protein